MVERKHESEDLRILCRDDMPIKKMEKEFIKEASLEELDRESKKAYPQKISIENRFYSEPLDDLVLMELEPLSTNIKESYFFPIKDRHIKNPKVGTEVYLMGFSKELTRQVSRKGDLAVFPYAENSIIVDADVNSIKLDSQRHFLTDYSPNDSSVDPHGLSGCGVWARLPSGEKNLWTTNLYLIGVQHGYHEKAGVLVATRIEKLLALIN